MSLIVAKCKNNKWYLYSDTLIVEKDGTITDKVCLGVAEFSNNVGFGVVGSVTLFNYIRNFFNNKDISWNNIYYVLEEINKELKDCGYDWSYQGNKTYALIIFNGRLYLLSRGMILKEITMAEGFYAIGKGSSIAKSLNYSNNEIPIQTIYNVASKHNAFVNNIVEYWEEGSDYITQLKQE